MPENTFSGLSEYELMNLPVHLIAAGHLDDLHHLLAFETRDGINAWYKLKEHIGDIAGYLNDIDLAWSNESISVNSSTSDTERRIVNQIRYALTHTSINSIAKKMSPALMIHLVRVGIWKSTRGLAYCNNLPEERQKGLAFTELFSLLNRYEQKDVLDLVRHFRDKNCAAKTLANISNNYSQRNRKQLIMEAVGIANTISNLGERAECLVYLAQLISTPKSRVVFLSAFSAIKKEPSDLKKLMLVENLANQFPIKLREELYEIALSKLKDKKDENYVASYLVNIAPHLSDINIICAFEVAKYLWDDSEMVRALSGLAPFLSHTLLKEALRLVLHATDNSIDRAKGLGELIPHLKGFLLIRALIATCSLLLRPEGGFAILGIFNLCRNVSVKTAITLNRVYKRLKSAKLRRYFVLPLFQKSISINRFLYLSVRDWFDFLEIILVELDKECVKILFEETIKRFDYGFGVERWMAKSISVLFPYLDENQREKVLKIMSSFRYSEDRIHIMAHCITFLSTKQKKEMMSIALREIESLALSISSHYIGEKDDNLYEETFESMFLLISQISPSRLPDIYRIVKAIKNIEARNTIMQRLVLYLPMSLTQKAIKIIELIEDNEFQELTFKKRTTVEKHKNVDALSPRKIQEILVKLEFELDKGTASIDSAVSTLAHLCEFLPESLISHYLKVTNKIPQVMEHGPRIEIHPDHYYTYPRSDALVSLARRYGILGRPNKALAIAKKLETECLSESISKIADVLPMRYVSRILNLVIAINVDEWRSNAIIGIAPFLSDEKDILIAYEASKSISDYYWQYRIRAISALVPHLLRKQVDEVYSSVLNSEKSIQVNNLLIDLILRTAELGDTQNAIQWTEKLQDNKWKYFALASILSFLSYDVTREITNELLEKLGDIYDDEWQAKIICKMAERIPDDYILKASRVVKVISDESYQVQALLSLAPKLPRQSFLDIWLEIAELNKADTFPSPDYLERLYKYAVTLSVGDRKFLFEETLRRLSTHPRNDLLCNIPVLISLVSNEHDTNIHIWSEITKAVSDVAHWWP